MLLKHKILHYTRESTKSTLYNVRKKQEKFQRIVLGYMYTYTALMILDIVNRPKMIIVYLDFRVTSVPDNRNGIICDLIDTQWSGSTAHLGVYAINNSQVDDMNPIHVTEDLSK